MVFNVNKQWMLHNFDREFMLNKYDQFCLFISDPESNSIIYKKTFQYAYQPLFCFRGYLPGGRLQRGRPPLRGRPPFTGRYPSEADPPVNRMTDKCVWLQKKKQQPNLGSESVTR